MKTQAWTKPTESAEPEKQGLLVDDLVKFVTEESGGSGTVPAVSAFLMAVEFISRNRAFEIRDAESFDLWLSYDGKALEGKHSIQQVVHDTAVILDAIVKKNVKAFADAAMQSFRARTAEPAAGLPAPAATTDVLASGPSDTSTTESVESPDTPAPDAQASDAQAPVSTPPAAQQEPDLVQPLQADEGSTPVSSSV
jgi:hypothetical protein